MRTLIKHLVLFVVYAAIGLVVAIVGVYVHYLQGQPALKPWHAAPLTEEYRADRAGVRTLDDYLALEERLFAELDREVYADTPEQDRRKVNRYFAGSLADARGVKPDWNRTVELVPSVPPKAGALLVHGLSDSPYSLRALAERLVEKGVHVLVLRVPGHGTAPSGLLDVTWRDWAGAVRIGAAHVRGKTGADRPLYFVGYSTGAALALEYALARAGGEALPALDRIVMISPAIGVSPVAALAIWQARAARLFGDDKLLWSSTGVEYDPYKYVSFAVNAGDQIYRLTAENAARIARLASDNGGTVPGLPPILAFVSVADATVSSEAVVDVLFSRIADARSELVLFDVDRRAEYDPLIDSARAALAPRLLADASAGRYGLTVIANEALDSNRLVLRERPAGATAFQVRPSGLAWPEGLFATSHVALPFAPDDPVYGERRPVPQQLVYLGRASILGERGLLQIPPADLTRLRFNPFFPYLERRVYAFLGLE